MARAADDGRPHLRLLPLLRPEFVLEPPTVQLPTRTDATPVTAPFADLALDVGSAWHVTTHIFPAAWPRQRRRSAQDRHAPREPVHLARRPARDRDALAREAAWYIEHQSATGFIDLDNPETFAGQEQLWIAVNRYARRRPASKPGRTYICVHANGFTKEVRRAAMQGAQTETSP